MGTADTTASRAPAIARAAAILRLLGKSDAPLGVHAIARELTLVPSTCLYVLRALVAEELVLFDAATKRYALDAGVLTLARQWLRRSRFADLAQPMLDRLCDQFEVTMIGVQVVGLDHMVVVGVAQSGHSFQLSTQVGSRFPVLISATGRCNAAFADFAPAELERRFHTLRWDDPPPFDRWLAEVEQTRVRGYAIDEGNYIAGVTVVAAPVWQAPGAPTHALVATGLGNALHRRGLPALCNAVLAGARALTRQLSDGPATD
ncbi:helix-turn-helix domain-containing protein [Sphingomonas ginsenosidivorax]|uniref:Helix-turn-helix domain-containing protein n=1 Tax=Sphingomonas ginsenosidivorax TaxID=862135 RepID=A0A5C6UBY9_9SPHN|nr:IclR family transcriptional regulator C-terminal domain-containing protein [Sphingomonas ginsenosidivorax]TXC70219.1 helix-turn-helix domain-containing protein [Sphingomonas ginsenosidivorax]